jgi:hypothetical protein
MKKNLPILALLASELICGQLAAQSPTPSAYRRLAATSTPHAINGHVSGLNAPVAPSATAPPATAAVASPSSAPGERLLVDVLSMLEAQRTVSAKMRQRVDLFGHQLVGAGAYWQQGRGAERLLRLEMKLQVAEQITSMQQVCDGASLWIHQDLLDRNSLSRIDLRRVQAARQNQPVASPSQASAVWLALGGLPRLIENLNANFAFGAVESTKLNELSVIKVQGQWEPAKLAEILPEQKDAILAGKAADLSKLPDQLPDAVVVMIGRDDMFPYRIEYHRHVAPDAKVSTTKTKPAADRVLLVMEFYEVQINGPIDPRQFVYSPAGLPIVDQTAAYLTLLGLSETK